MSRHQIICSFFFTTTVNTEVYRGIIEQSIAILELDERHTYFQQVRARTHTTTTTINFLQEFFGNWLVSTGLWLPRSPDLTQLHFFLWDHLKTKVFQTPYLPTLRARITEQIQKVTPLTLHRGFRNLRRRAVICKNNLGTQFQQLM